MNKVEIDERTGLPKLPEEYFWRVYATYRRMYERQSITVELRKKVWFWSVEVSHDSTWVSTAPYTPEDDVKYLAAELAKRFYSVIYRDDLSYLNGDYPPKALSVTKQTGPDREPPADMLLNC